MTTIMYKPLSSGGLGWLQGFVLWENSYFFLLGLLMGYSTDFFQISAQFNQWDVNKVKFWVFHVKWF